MTASKRKGTAWESAVVAYLRENGAIHAERRALAGAADRGDVAGLPGVVVECKNEKAFNLAGWLDEASVECDNDGADVGLAWAKRRGKTDPGAGYVVMSGETLVKLLRAAGYIPGTP